MNEGRKEGRKTGRVRGAKGESKKGGKSERKKGGKEGGKKGRREGVKRNGEEKNWRQEGRRGRRKFFRPFPPSGSVARPGPLRFCLGFRLPVVVVLGGAHARPFRRPLPASNVPFPFLS